MQHTFVLPTTGAVQWQTFLQDPEGSMSPAIALTANARGRLRSVLKKSKRTDEAQRDWSQICSTVEDYLPCLCGIMICVEKDTLLLRQEPTFSWRASLSASKLKAPPRVVMPSLYYELVYTLLVLALAHANAATTSVQSLGDYERQRHTSESERKRLDEIVNMAADRLCRAAGILHYLSETIIPRWEVAVPSSSNKGRPAETTREVTAALSSICLADAERLAIRRLLTRAVSDSTVAPGHPLPRSHPSPSLLAKMHIHVASLYDNANGQIVSLPSYLQPSEAIRKYVAENAALAHGLAHKWLGVDQGERDGAGEAVAWLMLAKEELKPILKKQKGASATELDSIDSFLDAYKRLNDTVSFQPVPKASTLLARVPGGRAALAIRPFTLPPSRFDGSKTARTLEADLERLALAGPDPESDSEDETVATSAPYAMKGGYY